MTTIGLYDIGKSHDPGIQQEPCRIDQQGLFFHVRLLPLGCLHGARRPARVRDARWQLARPVADTSFRALIAWSVGAPCGTESSMALQEQLTKNVREASWQGAHSSCLTLNE
jgi:hypothetical protein